MAIGAGCPSCARDDQRRRRRTCAHEAPDAGGRLTDWIPHSVGDRSSALDDMASPSGRTTSPEPKYHTPCRHRVPVVCECRRKRHLSGWPERRLRGGHEGDAPAVDSDPQFAHRPRAARHGRSQVSVLVARQQRDRLFHEQRPADHRPIWGGRSHPRARGRWQRRHVECRRDDCVQSQRSQPAVPGQRQPRRNARTAHHAVGR